MSRLKFSFFCRIILQIFLILSLAETCSGLTYFMKNFTQSPFKEIGIEIRV